jgi:hypothetical protein
MARPMPARSTPWSCVLIIFGVSLVPRTAATEKHWIAHEAEAIVVGKLTASSIFPWVDGWHINGLIRVDDTLYGDRLPGQINFHFVCRWDAMCRWWPPPGLPPMFKERGPWFLRHLDESSWKPSDGLGFQSLSDRAEWEDYIRRFKR